MVSDFRRNKLIYVFKTFFDINGSGNVDKSDFDILLEKIAKSSQWKVGDASYKEAQETLNKIWLGISAADSDKDGEVSEDEWIALWEKSTTADWQNLYCKFMFDLEDDGNDGSIDEKEYTSTYEAYGVPKAEASAAFQKMCKGKATVSWTEFQALWTEYFTTEDKSASGNFIFGKSSW